MIKLTNKCVLFFVVVTHRGNMVLAHMVDMVWDWSDSSHGCWTDSISEMSVCTHALLEGVDHKTDVPQKFLNDHEPVNMGLRLKCIPMAVP